MGNGTIAPDLRLIILVVDTFYPLNLMKKIAHALNAANPPPYPGKGLDPLLIQLNKHLKISNNLVAANINH